MNAVEIEEAVSALAEAPFDMDEFPYAFLEAFGNKATTIKRLRSGVSNRSDTGGVLQTGNIHIKTCALDHVAETLAALRDSPANARAKAKFILASDGHEVQAEDLTNGDVVVCNYPGLSGSFRVLPAARGHLDRQADPRERLRHQGDRTPEPAIYRTPEGQSGLGQRCAPSLT